MSETFTQAPRTALGSLTSTWTAPKSCSLAMAACSTCNLAYAAQTCGDGSFLSDNVACWPPRNDSRVSTPAILLAWGFYSPGLHCPHGYTSACSATAGGTSNFDVAFTLTGQETAIGCCPSDYSCAPGYRGSQTCVQVVSTTTTFATATCTDGQTGGFEYITVPNSGMSSYSTYAPLFQLVHQPSDFSSDLSSQPGSTAHKTASLTSPPSETASSHGKSGISTKAQIGVGVGVGVGVLALLLLGFFFFRRRQSQAKQGGENHNVLVEAPSGHRERQYMDASSPSMVTTAGKYNPHGDGSRGLSPSSGLATERHEVGGRQIHGPPTELPS